MKGVKSNRQPYGNTERKNGKRSEKSAKLDRKSSRGMIYENEELRLRTININAEVERGQSDIKRLRRENEHLRREIWTLRDECDRLNKRFKAKLVENTHDHGGCSARGSGASGGCSGRRGSCDGMHSNSNSDDSDSCDTCKGNNDDHCVDDYKYTPNDCCYDGSCKLPPFSVQQQQQLLANELTVKFNNTQAPQNLPRTATSTAADSGNSENSEAQQLNTNFDHLSVVSEETMSNSEILPQAQQSDNLLGSQMTLPSLMGPLTPLTPIEMIANELNDLQAMVPPLSYFENVVQRHMATSTSPESSNTTNSGKTVINTNGWDYNLQSPFTQRKYPSHSSSSSSSAPRSPLTQARYSPAQTLTTFVPSNTLNPPPIVRIDVGEEEQPVAAQSNVPSIETVAITTIPPSSPSVNSPKHFFAPLKPRLKINTSLANKNLLATPVSLPTVPSVVSPTPTTQAAHDVQPQNRNPPDIFVANALASPYQRPMLATTTATTSVLPLTQLSPPPLPLRQSPQVSPRQQRRHSHQHHNHHQQLQHHHQHQHQLHKRHQQQLHIVTADIVVAKIDDAADVVENASTTAAAGTNTKSPQLQQSHVPQQEQQLQQNFSPIYTKLNEPIYATAKKRCNNLISAPAVTQPLMTTAIVATPPTHARKSSNVSSITTSVGQKQTDSANLEAILNDIETISEDILAIQLDKNKSRDNINITIAAAPENNSTSQKTLQQNDKNKKPYRSEMNLMLAYDGTNPTITPTTSTAANVVKTVTTSVTNDNNNTARRTRSLEREHTESPSPNVPDPMVPFPPNRTYIGFDQLNAAAGNRKPPLPPSQIVAQVPTSGGSMAKIGSASSKPGTPIKVLPPLPPVRTLPPTLNLRNASTMQSPQQTTTTEQLSDQTTKSSPIVGLAPNKSHLFAAIANAAVAKRAQFLAAPAHLSRSLDTDGLMVDVKEQDTQSAEAAKKKARRVSIVCGDSANDVSDEAMATSVATTATISTTPQGSCTDLKAVNPIIMHLRQTSHSTPNSPHSMRRGSNDLTEKLSVGTPHHHNSYTPGVQSQTQHQLQPSSLALAQHRKSSQDSTNCITAAAAELAAAAAAAVASRSKCSRRHSDGTVVAGVQRISGASSHHHHHHGHHRHHHQHSSSIVSNNPHHSHQSHPESNHDSAESISDRNSSIASSRDSSTSFSMRSQRRKISVSSHTGGKIPWCGCWGNGCL